MATSSAGRTLTDDLREYHEYLEKTYRGGCDRFFSPTGFLQKFQRTVEVKAQSVRSHVFVKDVDEATQKLESAIAGTQDVFDLTAEPGTGKTSVLPFRFPSKKVVVALPTPFDAFNAYTMATGECCLKLKGLRLGKSDARVVYTDSYLAAYAILSNYLDFDIMIVDECDSDRGVTKFLAEVKAKGKLLIRMSATHGRKQAGLSKAFRVTEVNDMPDVRDGLQPVANYVKSKARGRALVLAPDAQTAKELSTLVPGSRLVTTETRLDVLAMVMTNIKADCLFISDDTCGRALNLNLDAVFDTQLISEYAQVRPLTAEELYQRTGRVGRNREGYYYAPGIPVKSKQPNDFDVARNNVVRALAHVPQHGESRLHVEQSDVEELMCADVEPYSVIQRKLVDERAIVSSGSSNGGSSKGYNTPAGSRPQSPTEYAAPGDAEVSKIVVPSWVAYFNGYTSNAGNVGKQEITKSFVITNDRGEKAFQRRKSSGSSSGRTSDRSDRSIGSVITDSFKGRSVVSHRAAPFLPEARDAPYAAVRSQREVYRPRYNVPEAPPVVDLTQLNYDLDWPSLIRDRLSRGGDLPTIVPYGSWRHTSAGGMGTDWFRRLDDMATSDNRFDDAEFEVVCRAWNKLAAQAWVRRTPGLSNVGDAQRLEYCVRYFQSHFVLGTVD